MLRCVPSTEIIFRAGENMAADRVRSGFGEDRRGLLKKVLVLGTAAPLAGALAGVQTAMGQQRSTLRRSLAQAGLSSQQMAGQRVVFSYPGLTVPSALLQQITAGEAAGVIFFGENISSDAQIASVVQQLRQAQQQSPVPSPLLLMTDQEGGLVRRLPGEPVLSEKQIGQSADPPAAASQAGTGAGQNLAGVGMNLNLAPVLDVFCKSGNFIDQYQRSYSNDAQIATSCGQAFITAQQQTGVAATAQGELRGRLGYQGVTITDALEAGALAAFGTSAQRAVLAAQAGMDLILCSARDVTQGQAVTAGLASALDSGQLNSADFTAAVQRVTALRAGLQ